MKTNTLFAALILVAGLATGASVKADDVAKPSLPPAVADSSSDRSSADEPSVIDHVVYLAKLPTPDELVKGADAKGTPILRMDQTSDRIVVVYQYSGGRTATFAYTLLSSSNAPTPIVSRNNIATPTPAPPVTRPTTVVYQDPDVVYYEPRVRYYDPAWDFWTPLAVGVGLGWGFGGHGGYHGYHGGGWHGGHGGWHR